MANDKQNLEVLTPEEKKWQPEANQILMGIAVIGALFILFAAFAGKML